MGANVNVTTHYPYSEKYVYETTMEILNLDEERVKDITTGNGFIISAPKAIKDDLKDDNEELIEKIDNNRIRAITFVGFDTVPQGFYRKHKILYAYYMEPIEGTDGFWIENIKSN